MYNYTQSTMDFYSLYDTQVSLGKTANVLSIKYHELLEHIS